MAFNERRIRGRRSFCRLQWAVYPLLAGVLPAQRAAAIVYRSDETDATAVGLATQNQFSGVGVVTNQPNNEYGTGTLILSDWVLTAKHVVTGYTTASYDGVSGTIYTDSASDLALIHLNSAVSGAITPINSFGGEVGKSVWIDGYGTYGTVGGSLTANSGYKARAGTNIVKSYTGGLLYYDNNNTGGTPYEASTAPGDSGGPMFQQVNNVWYTDGTVLGADSNGFSYTPTNPHQSWIAGTISSYSSSTLSLSQTTGPTSMTWDATLTSDGASDGGGTWDLIRTNFYNATTTFNYEWDNGMYNNVTFGNANGAAGTITLAAAMTAHNLTFNAATSGNYSIAGGGYVLTLATGGTSTGDPTITANTGALISATIAGSSSTLTKAGSGTLTLSAANTFTGGVIINGGMLALAGGSNRLLATTTVKFGGSSTLTLGGNSQTITGLTIADSTNGTISGGSLILNAAAGASIGGNSATIDLSGLTGFTFSQANQIFAVNGNTTTVNYAQGASGNSITSAAFNVGTGNFGSSINTSTTVYLGTKNIINADSIQIGNYHASGSVAFASGLTGATATLRGQDGASRIATLIVGTNGAGAQSQTATFDLTGGTIDALVGAMTISSYGVSSGSASETATFGMGAGTLDATSIMMAQSTASTSGGGAGTVNATFNQQAGLVRTGSLTLGSVGNAAQGTGTQATLYTIGTASTLGTLMASTISAGALNANTTATRSIMFNNGTIQNFNDGAGGTTNLNIAGTSTAGKTTDSGTLNITLGSTGSHTFYADSGTTIAAQSTAVLSGNGGTLIKDGAGALRLYGAETYSGATSVVNGSMIVSGTLASPTVTVASTGTLGGSGRLAGAVSSVGTIAVGDTAGTPATLTVTGGLVLGTDSTIALDLGDANGSDKLSTTSLTLNTKLHLSVTPGTAFIVATYSLIDYSTLTNTSSNFSGWTVAGLSSAIKYNFALGSDSAIGTNALNLVVTAVPEPTTLGLALPMAGVLLARRRRRAAV